MFAARNMTFAAAAVAAAAYDADATDYFARIDTAGSNLRLPTV
jgi:hypothetical protein